MRVQLISANAFGSQCATAYYNHLHLA